MLMPLPILLLALLFLALVAYANLDAWSRRGEWHPDPILPRMRRRFRGRWQYRPMTYNEQLDMEDRNAW